MNECSRARVQSWAVRYKRMSEQCKRMDEVVAQYFRPDSWLTWTLVQWSSFCVHLSFVTPSSCLRSQENLVGVGPKIEMVQVAPKMEIVNVVSATKIEMVNVGTKIEIQPQTQAIPPPQLQPHQPSYA